MLLKSLNYPSGIRWYSKDYNYQIDLLSKAFCHQIMLRESHTSYRLITSTSMKLHKMEFRGVNILTNSFHPWEVKHV